MTSYGNMQGAPKTQREDLEPIGTIREDFLGELWGGKRCRQWISGDQVDQTGSLGSTGQIPGERQVRKEHGAFQDLNQVVALEGWGPDVKG